MCTFSRAEHVDAANNKNQNSFSAYGGKKGFHHWDRAY